MNRYARVHKGIIAMRRQSAGRPACLGGEIERHHEQRIADGVGSVEAPVGSPAAPPGTRYSAGLHRNVKPAVSLPGFA